MINKFKRAPEVRQLFFLALIQGGNALVPLGIIPYLYFILDRSDFSKIFSVEAWVLAFTPFILYSFELTPVSNITDKSSKEKVSIYIYQVLIVRAILYMGIASGALIFCHLIEFTDIRLLSIWLIYPLGVMLQFNGIFLAIQKNDVLAFAVLIGKTCLILSIFVVFRNMLNLYLVSSIMVFSQLIQGCITVFWLNRRYHIFKNEFVISDVLRLMKNDFSIAMGYGLIPLFRGGATLILTVVGTSDAISFFVLVEKLAKAAQALLRPLSQVQFRRLAISVDRASGGVNVGVTIAKHLLPQVTLLIACSILAYLYLSRTNSELISAPSLYVLIIMNLAVVFGICNFIVGQGYLNFIGMKDRFLFCVFFSGAATVTLGIVIIPGLQSLGAAISYFSGELLLLICCSVIVKKANLND